MNDSPNDVQTYERRKRYSLRDRRYSLFGIGGDYDGNDEDDCGADAEQKNHRRTVKLFCVSESDERERSAPDLHRRRYSMFGTDAGDREDYEGPSCCSAEPNHSASRRTESPEEKEAGAVRKRMGRVHRRRR